MRIRVVRDLQMILGEDDLEVDIPKGWEFEVVRTDEGAWSTRYWVRVPIYIGLVPLQPDEVEVLGV